MSNETNTRLEEQAQENFMDACAEDYEFSSSLAAKYFDPVDYYLLCKDDRWDEGKFEVVFDHLIKLDYEKMMIDPIGTAKHYLKII